MDKQPKQAKKRNFSDIDEVDVDSKDSSDDEFKHNVFVETATLYIEGLWKNVSHNLGCKRYFEFFIVLKNLKDLPEEHIGHLDDDFVDHWKVKENVFINFVGIIINNNQRNESFTYCKAIFKIFCEEMNQKLNSFYVSGHVPDAPVNTDFMAVQRSIQYKVGEKVLDLLMAEEATYILPQFQLLRELSLLTYERLVTDGNLIVFGDVSPIVEFVSPVKINYTKNIRKLLEVAKNMYGLLINKEYDVIGLCEVNKRQMSYVEFCGKDSFNIGH